MTQTLKDKNILLIISGGIAAYKSLELIRLIKKSGGSVRCILTKGGERFITPLSVAALSENEAYTDLWSLKDETDLPCEALAKQGMGHIRLSREADLIVIAPASANLIAKMAGGYADDLASTTLLAADKTALFAPAMNHKMWDNQATQNNIAKLLSYGHTQIGPTEGDMACGEFGMGRMAEPDEIFEAIKKNITDHPIIRSSDHLKGRTALVTSGPTFEPIDPVRFIGNRSSGKQGHAITAALTAAGANVTLVTGPTALKDPSGVKTIKIETAAQMLAACESALPADIAICAAAVGDWAPEKFDSHKIKKRKNDKGLKLNLKENPDILRTLSRHKKRPALVIGFAAETDSLIKNAQEKRSKKGCDWIMANDVGAGENVFGGDENHVYLITGTGTEDWGRTSKAEVARKLTAKITEYLENHDQTIRAAE